MRPVANNRAVPAKALALTAGALATDWASHEYEFEYDCCCC